MSDENRTRDATQVLERIEDLRTLLTTDRKNPILKLIEQCASVAGPGTDISEAFRYCVIDLLRGRLRRLEEELKRAIHGQRLDDSNGKSGTVLLVEDDPIWIEIGKYILEGRGYNVVVASTTEEVGKALRKQLPAVILMDIHLGADNGIQLTRFIRQGSICPDVPIIVVTADRFRQTFLEANELRIQGYILKPYRADELLERVRKYVKVNPMRMAESESTVDAGPN